MGLLEGDDLDALALFNPTGELGDAHAYFSLAPGSPTLTSWGASPADVFYTDFSGASSSYVVFTAADLGLLPTDNVDALETNAVPEPGTLLLMVGILSLLPKSWRRSA